MENLKLFAQFTRGSLIAVARGGKPYYAWLLGLGVLIGLGLVAYGDQLSRGLITTNMRDQVSWGFYIGNFAFLVGVAAAAVVLVVPAYVYNWGPIREVALVGELLSVAAIVMCMLFVTVDVGRPELLWHLLPIAGTPNFPHSLLTWDILVLNVYFLINWFVVTYILFMAFTGRKYNPRIVLPIIFLSIPFAVGIHTVTAFLFTGLKSRPFWHTALLAPRFIASAFCSGPALIFLIFRVLRKVGGMKIADAALFKIGELLAYAMALNLFFVGTEVFTDFYAQTSHSIHARFQWFGIHGESSIAAYTWSALGFNVVALIIFIVPYFRRKLNLLTLGCALSFFGIFIEKGMGLLLPGFTPDVLGEIYEYAPSANEVLVGIGIWAVGALLFTLMVRVAIAITQGKLRVARA
ncbi:MAG TPA: NrfD/PsrC family molybdoenzyme membrane anchor subunit [Myxococcota bacterium]|nr:NrfD/PsrC family molybdoenzyme membrane anchor subunit [Myxococcota bacterium]